MCALCGKVVESFLTLAPAGAAIFPGESIRLHPEVIAESLFGDAYAAFVDRAAVAGKLRFRFAPNTVTEPRTLEEAAQEFTNSLYEELLRQGEPPRKSPELYAMKARASRNAWPVYFLAIGMNLDLPAEAYYGKTGLPKQ
jgi:hypothetical protein